MKNKIALLLISVLLLVKVNIAQAPLKVLSSSIIFKIKNAGLTVTGSFSGFTGEINFNPELYKQAKITASVDVNTIHTGITARDRHLQKEEYFNAEKFPTITMVSRFFGKEGNKFTGYFKLTVKGVTKDIVIPFIFDNNIIKGEFTLNRKDFNVGGNSIIMGDEVSVSIQINTGTKTN
ncbi:MAG: YceI family protein [Bacteroidota bacterium]